MLGSNPSADSVASTDRGLKGDATRHPSFLFEETPHREGIKALNPGVRGQSPRSPPTK